MDKDKLAEIDRLLQLATKDLEFFNKTKDEYGIYLRVSIYKAQSKISHAISLVDDMTEDSL